MKIVVLAGGLSTERDVSLISGTQVCKALRKKGHLAILLDVFCGYEGELDLEHVFEERETLTPFAAGIAMVEPDLEKIKKGRGTSQDGFFGPNVLAVCKKADIVYMGLHGAEGENGKIQAAFDLLGIRYTGSGYLGSAIAMDKGMAKKVFQKAGIPTPEGYSVFFGKAGKTSEVGYPCVVKPCCGGSSVGVSFASNDEEFKKALENGFRYENELLVEHCIKGREFSVGVIAGKSLPIIEIIPKEGFYDYKTKYQSGLASDVCPAELSREITEKMQAYAVRVFEELKLGTYARMDFLLDEEDNMYCLEANTLPGMTPTSLLPQEALVTGVDYGDLCEQIIGKSMEGYEKRERHISGEHYGVDDLIDVFPSKMAGMTIEKIVAACHGTYYGPKEALSQEIAMITTDSRKIGKDYLFVAIKGERVNGNRFVSSAYEEGALVCLSEEPSQDETKPYIVVDSSLQALKDMAALYREITGTKIIGITGSVGKTTTKEMVACVLSEHFCTLKTKGNFNNEIGVPLTLFRLRKEHEVAVVEMGISEFGEMTRLSQVVKPDACVITNIGQCHLETLGDRDGVLKAKTEIFSYLSETGQIYLNGDDDKLETVSATGKRTLTFFGFGTNNQVYAENIKNLGLRGTNFEAVTQKGRFPVHVAVPGKHMVSNALAAIAIALDFGMTQEEIIRGIEKFRPVGGHSNIIETGKYTILDDCYNANPASMRAGIDVLRSALGRKVAILGDMFELGEEENELHASIGRYAAAAEPDLLVFVGELSGNSLVAAEKMLKKKETLFYFSTREELEEKLPELLKEGDTILVKASHGMHFEKIVEKIKNM